LKEDSASKNSHEHIILHYTFEHVYFFHLSRADLIKNLKKTSAFQGKLHNLSKIKTQLL